MNGRLAIVAACAAICACADRSADYKMPVDLLGPGAVGEALVYIERNRNAAYAFRMPGWQGSAIDLAVGATRVVPRNGRTQGEEQLLVLSTGSSDATSLGEQPALSLLRWSTRDGSAALELDEYPLRRPFGELAQSDDGKYVVVYSNGSNARSADEGSTNEVAVIDLCSDEACPDPAARVRMAEVQSFGLPVREVIIGGGRRGMPRFAALRFDTHVSLLRLDGLGDCEFIVQGSGDEPSSFRPAQVLFSGRWVVVRDAASSNLLAAEWTSKTLECAEDAFYERSFQLNGPPVTMVDYGRGAHGSERYVLAVVPAGVSSEASTLTEVDLERGTSQELALDFPVTRVQRERSDHSSFVLLYTPAETDAWVAVLELGDVLALTDGSPIRLPQGLDKVLDQLACPDRSGSNAATGSTCCAAGTEEQDADCIRFLLTYPRTGAGILDPQAIPLSLRSFARDLPFRMPLLDPTRKLWSDPLGQRRLSYADLDEGGEVFTVDVGAATEALISVTPQAESSLVVAVHPSTVGDATLIELAKLASSHAHTPKRRRLFLEPGLVGQLP
jgi:hypothetical protein